MVKKHPRLFAIAFLLAALPAASLAQDAKAVLGDSVKAMGAGNLKTIFYSASGSSYPPGTSNISVKSYTQDIDLDARTSRVRWIRVHGTPPAEETENVAATPDSPWATQLEFWLTPHGFLRGAMAAEATVEARKAYGDQYKVVTVKAQNKYNVVGYINDQNMVERVQAWTDDPASNDLIEATYRQYEDFNGFKFPSVIIHHRGGALSSVLIVSEVKPNPPVRSGE